VLPPGVVLQLDEGHEASNQTNPEPCTVAGTEYNHGQQVGCALNLGLEFQENDKFKGNK
jgi:hypothetical protein